MISKTTRLQDQKNILGHLPTIKIEVPNFVYIATDNARCPKSEIFINEGDHVNCYQLIGMRHGGFFDQPIHSTVSGTFVGYEEHYHRSGKKVRYIKIENDHLDTPDPSVKARTKEEVEALTKDEITEIVKNCASVGLGGSSFPTYIKFQTKEKIDTILINGIECEPYITADHRLMLEEPENVIEGLQLIMKAFGAKRGLICIKKKYKDIEQVYREIIKRYPDSGIELSLVGNFYPQGWEIAMIKSATGIKVKTGELPSKYGIMNFNVSTVVGIRQAILENKPVIERLIAVTGDGINYPSNFKVRVGTPIKFLIDKCGGYKNPEIPKVFILGGPMMGASLPSDDTIATKTVTSIIVLNHPKDLVEQPCIRCGSCVYSCPVGLEPVQIMNAVKAMDKARVKSLNPLKCIECGLCSYSCTSSIRVTDYVRRGKVIAKLP